MKHYGPTKIDIEREKSSIPLKSPVIDANLAPVNIQPQLVFTCSKSTIQALESHLQLQYALDVDLITQAHVHTCVSTYNKVIFSCSTH